MPTGVIVIGGRTVLTGIFALFLVAALAAPSFAASFDGSLQKAVAERTARGDASCGDILAALTDCGVDANVAGRGGSSDAPAVNPGGSAAVDPTSEDVPALDLTLVLTNTPTTDALQGVPGTIVAAQPVADALAATGARFGVSSDDDATRVSLTNQEAPGEDEAEERLKRAEDHEYLARAGYGFVASGWDPSSAHSRADPATAPPPEKYDAVVPAVVSRDVESQGATGRHFADNPLTSSLSEPQVAAAVAAGIALLTLVPWALYHRIRGNETLTNKTRKAIYDAVLDNPGIGVQEVADAAGVTYSTASYHLDRLVGAGMLVGSATGNRLRYYKNGGFSESERKIVPILENAEACRVLQCIIESPWTYRAAIAQKLGVSTTTVNWHLKRLLKADLVTEVKEGRSVHLYVDRTKLADVVLPVAEKLQAPPEEAQRIIERIAVQRGAAPLAAPA